MSVEFAIQDLERSVVRFTKRLERDNEPLGDAEAARVKSAARIMLIAAGFRVDWSTR